MTTSQSIGSFGNKGKQPVDLHFDWFGQQIRVNPGAGEIELMEWLPKAAAVAVLPDKASLAESIPAMGAVFEFLRGQVHPDDWAVFIDLAKTHRQDTSDLMEVAMAIVEAVSNFPTGQPSDSSDGQPSTPENSGDGSSSVATRALAHLDGRPDLQTGVFQAHESRMAAV